jgi:type II secretory pathway pseudopilin PulG
MKSSAEKLEMARGRGVPAPRNRFFAPSRPQAQSGFTIIETTIVVLMMAILILAGLNTVTLLDRSSRRQALHTSAMELAQGRIEELQALAYNPPLAPFGASATTQSTNVILALDRAGSGTLVGGTMATSISPVAQGHLVTVTVSTTYANQLMNVQLQTVINEKSGNSAHSQAQEAAGFTITEAVIAIATGVLVVAMFAVFTESTGRTLLSLTSQSSHNQAAGNGTEFMISRVRKANTFQLDATGNTLTLSFDDNPDADSDGDGVKWNDRDHDEEFQFVDADNTLSTLSDNTITYRANTNSPARSVLIPAGTRKVSGLPIFRTNSAATVYINFGLLTTNSTPFSQAIEIRTSAVMRNRRQ